MRLLLSPFAKAGPKLAWHPIHRNARSFCVHMSTLAPVNLFADRFRGIGQRCSFQNSIA